MEVAFRERIHKAYRNCENILFLDGRMNLKELGYKGVSWFRMGFMASYKQNYEP
jgi:hypothetical protein